MEHHCANNAVARDAFRAIGGSPVDLNRVLDQLISREEAFVVQRLIAAEHRVRYEGADLAPLDAPGLS
jgi:hypothetical protein